MMLCRILIASAFSVATLAPVSAGLINNQLNQAWVSLRDLTSSQFSTNFTKYKNAGYRMIDIDVYPNGGGLLYSQVWEKNSDKRGWAEYRDMTSSQYNTRWTQLRKAGYRPSDIKSYRSGSVQHYAGIWVKNTENLAWSSKRDLTSSQFSSYFTEQRNLGRRIIDIEVYPTTVGLRYAAIWYQNVGNVAWIELRDMSRSTYQTQLNKQAAAGYRLIDFESYQSGATQRYAAIWEQDPPGRAWVVRSDRSELDFANLWRLYRDEGYRLVDFERYNTSGGARYAGVWVENNSRFDYPRKGTLNSIIAKYRSDNNLPGISVAVIRNGTTIYRRGFGYADVGNGKWAHGETIYNAASVAKVIGGTLAGKLEAEDRLHDGTTFNLDLTKRVRAYPTHVPIGGGKFVTIPRKHRQHVDQLLAHLGCIAHYDTTPAIPNQTKHYTNAIAAVRSIWNVGLVNGCTIGSTLSYSTPAFTFVAAVLERVTGRTAARLLREEIARRYGLSTLRVQYELRDSACEL